MNTNGRHGVSTHYSTTNEPVVFVVESERAHAVLDVLNSELSDMYLRAWRDAISAVMEDCGWTYEEPQELATVRVERIRSGRPRVIHGIQIEAQLAGAIKAVDDVLDSVLSDDLSTATAVGHARRAQPESFRWRITEAFKPANGAQTRIMELLGSAFIDLAAAEPQAAFASE